MQRKLKKLNFAKSKYAFLKANLHMLVPKKQTLDTRRRGGGHPRFWTHS